MHWIDQSGKQHSSWQLSCVNNTCFFEELRSIQTLTNNHSIYRIWHILACTACQSLYQNENCDLRHIACMHLSNIACSNIQVNPKFSESKTSLYMTVTATTKNNPKSKNWKSNKLYILSLCMTLQSIQSLLSYRNVNNDQ